jgi:hypothetical protein
MGVNVGAGFVGDGSSGGMVGDELCEAGVSVTARVDAKISCPDAAGIVVASAAGAGALNLWQAPSARISSAAQSEIRMTR